MLKTLTKYTFWITTGAIPARKKDLISLERLGVNTALILTQKQAEKALNKLREKYRLESLNWRNSSRKQSYKKEFSLSQKEREKRERDTNLLQKREINLLKNKTRERER